MTVNTDIMLQTSTGGMLTNMGTVTTIGDVTNGMNGNWNIDNCWPYPNPYPSYPTFTPHPYWCACATRRPCVHTCACTCYGCLALATAIAALKPALPATATAPQPAAVVTPGPSLADTLAQQARTRIAEIQRRLDEVPALTAELERLQRMVDAGGK